MFLQNGFQPTMNATASVVNKIWKYLNVLQKWANMLQIIFCNNLTYKFNYQQVSNFCLLEINNALIWLEITCKWILDQKLIGFHYRLCSNNRINSCGLNSNNQTTAEDLNTRRRRYYNIHTSWYVEAYSTGYQST